MGNKTHTILGGKVHLYQRDDTPFWHCSTFLDGAKRRKSTKEESLSLAKDFAEDWFLTLKGKQRVGELKNEKLFQAAAKQFEREYEIITDGTRSTKWIQGHKDRIRLHLLPFFKDFGLSEITGGKVQEYRIDRIKNPRNGKPPAKSTLHDEIVTLRQVLKTAVRHGWLSHVPDLSAPFNLETKVTHRAWFTASEYKQLYEATRRRARKPYATHHKWSAEQLHDFVLFMANTGLRPDEAKLLQFRDVSVIVDEYSGDEILEIEVRGKRGIGWCISMPGAVTPFKRLKKRKRLPEGMKYSKDAELIKPKPSDLLFVGDQRKMLNRVLEEIELKFDRDGQARTAYSLRHTYICLRLLEGADIYQIAKNCRTSVEMIEKYYAAHLKNQLDASAINVRRKRAAQK